MNLSPDDLPIRIEKPWGHEVWYAWTEDPTNELGKKLRKERAAKVKALHAAATALRGSGAPLAA